ncbi:sigma factor-like helix-turn-helix DNA-binding protein [Nocardioides marmotae]|uniref:sigma factor-like helix-turn-helix DNA-binding protein n=1 Tax=Nocardioides marmotae TaxID=2663857 RepID=UPI0012B5B054|nr:sigma factor-like helix-turn-helix DNA-binding protein [Nocardioides marmotae]MBC9732205.1 transposase [Nocardioides marmotae]MTB83327.1 transposase [Nocardioides marmotae]
MGAAVAVLTVDQVRSRSGTDLVPELLDELDDHPLLRPFERTAGDELQGVVDRPETLAAVAGALLRRPGWYVGIGIGPVEQPLPASTRAGRGSAYLCARDAVTAAKTSPWHLRVVGEHPDARSLETTLWLWAAVLARRTARGWEVADLVAEGLTYEQVGRRLGISQSAVSQRAQAAGIVEARRAQELATALAARVLGQEAS